MHSETEFAIQKPHSEIRKETHSETKETQFLNGFLTFLNAATVASIVSECVVSECGLRVCEGPRNMPTLSIKIWFMMVPTKAEHNSEMAYVINENYTDIVNVVYTKEACTWQEFRKLCFHSFVF